MATTYCVNADIVLDSGKSIDSLLDADLSSSEKTERKDAARLRAYNKINEQYLVGKTPIPATHIAALKEIEIDLVISDIMTGAFSGEITNVSDWTEKYMERAKETLENLRFDASSESAVADSQNTGDGTVGTIVVNDHFTVTELWTLIAQNLNVFTVRGSLTGPLPNLTVGNAYPEKDWGTVVNDYGLILHIREYEAYPIYLTVTAGATDFVQYDRFTFKTFAASYYRQRDGNIIRG
ncbi:hypothetical protein LCGC14_1630360 [marine sediment metagenome]|uniref:Uncharacterized protein n=1 Tax=marine sediment metagenome TaxID=412755 RepID=A0A0F9I306_9ZZZZ